MATAMLLDLSVSVLRELDGIETSAQHFSHITHLECPTGCGRCCLSESVSATVLEMLPLAVELIRGGNATSWLQCLKKAGKRCVFYRPCPQTPQQGRCSVYRWRATICRLFPFAATRDKNGERQFSACKLQKRLFPNTAKKAFSDVADGSLKAPLYLQAFHRIANLDPRYGTALLPINKAVLAALSWLLTEQGYCQWKIPAAAKGHPLPC